MGFLFGHQFVKGLPLPSVALESDSCFRCGWRGQVRT